MKRTSQSGNTLIGVLVAIVVLGIIAIQFATQASQATKALEYMERKYNLLQLAIRASSIQLNYPNWLAMMRASSSTSSLMSSCLPLSGTNFNCPANDPVVAADAYLQSIIPAGWTTPAFSSVNLVDLNGKPLAGVRGTEVYFDKNGGPCDINTPGAMCAFKSTGYMVRQNQATNVNPGGFVFTLRMEAVSVNSPFLTFNLAPEYITLNSGSMTILANCPTGYSYVTGASITAGCIQNVSDGIKDYPTAGTDCLNISARLPSQAEWLAAAASGNPQITGLYSNWQWNTDTDPTGTMKEACGGSGTATCKAFSTTVNNNFRCWKVLN